MRSVQALKGQPGAVFVFLLVTSLSSELGQKPDEPIVCKHDWTKTRLAQLRERPWSDLIVRLARDCRDSRKIPWNEPIEELPKVISGLENVLRNAHPDAQRLHVEEARREIEALREALQLAIEERENLKQRGSNMPMAPAILPSGQTPPAALAGTAPGRPAPPASGLGGLTMPPRARGGADVPAPLPPLGTGRVTEVVGEGQILRGGVTYPLKEGWTLSAGDVVKMGHKASARYVLNDGSEMRLLENTSLEIPRRRYQAIDLIKGSIEWIRSGKPIEPTGTPLRIFTPVAVTSWRGTRFTIGYQPSPGADRLSLDVREGIVDVIDETGRATEVAAGQSYSSAAAIRPATAFEQAVGRALASRKPEDLNGRRFYPAETVPAGVWLDAAQWTPTLEAGDLMNFQHESGVSASMFAIGDEARTVREIEAGAATLLDDHYAGVEVDSVRRIEVNGITVTAIRLRATFAPTPLIAAPVVVDVRVFTGPQGVVEARVYNQTPDDEASRRAAESFLNGLIVRRASSDERASSRKLR